MNVNLRVKGVFGDGYREILLVLLEMERYFLAIGLGLVEQLPVMLGQFVAVEIGDREDIVATLVAVIDPAGTGNIINLALRISGERETRGNRDIRDRRAEVRNERAIGMRTAAAGEGEGKQEGSEGKWTHGRILWKRRELVNF